MKILIVTGANSSQEFGEMAAISFQSVRRYAALHPQIRVAKFFIEDPSGKHSWGKVPILLSLLQTADLVLWMDADALIIGKQDLAELCTGQHTLYISKDCNGINCGVMAWRRSREAIDALTRMQESRERLLDHIWFEQAALMEFVDELDVKYLPKEVFNAYEGEQTKDTLIMHWPGMENKARLQAMSHRLSLC